MSRSRPVLVHLTTTDISLELLLGNQLEAFAAAGYEVIGVSAPGPYSAELARRGVRHIPLRNATRAMDLLADARALPELIRLFRSLRPTIVHTHNPKPGVYGRIAARLAGVPVVVNTIHGLYAVPEDPALKRLAVYSAERLAATCSQAELLQNPEDVAVLRRWRIPADRITVLGNGIDLERFSPADPADADARNARRAELGAEAPDDVVVGLVGRLVREKGYPEVFEAAGLLRADHPEVRVAVIGPDDPDKAGSLTAEDRAAAAAAGVRLIGERTDLPPLYEAMDVFVLASHREGFPRAAMEAAALGVPIVATNIRGARQVVDDGATGLLVPPRDPRSLAAAIADLVEHPERRAEMGRAGRAKAIAEFDQQRCIDLTLATYRRLLGAKGHPIPTPRHPTPGEGHGEVRIRLAEAGDSAWVARLHADVIHEGFLPTLGHRFLTLLYRRMVRDPGSFVLVAEDHDGIVGFVAATDDTGALYRAFLRRDGLRAGLAAAPAILRSPRRTWETWRYGGAEDRHIELPRAEILATAVDSRVQGTGVGRRLVEETTLAFTARGVPEARVVTATGNDRAIRLYQGAGFIPNGTTEVHAGVTQEILVWR